jgi:hypothetical protein
VFIVLDNINSQIIIFTQGDLIQNSLKFNKISIQLNHSFKTVHRCFFHSEKFLNCIGTDGVYRIEVSMKNKAIVINDNRLNHYEAFLIKNVRDKQVVEEEDYAIVESVHDDYKIYIEINKGQTKFLSTRQSREADYSKLMAYREKREFANEDSFNRPGDMEDLIDQENLSKIKLRFLVSKTEFLHKESKVIMIGEKFYEYKKNDLRQIKTVKLQIKNVDEDAQTNVLFNNGNENILDHSVSIKEDYVIVFEDIKDVNKTGEYFVDFKEGTVIFYKFVENDQRKKIAGLKNGPKLIIVNKKSKDNEDSYIVKVSDLPMPTKDFKRPLISRLSGEGVTVYNAHGREDTIKDKKDLTEDDSVEKTDFKSIDLENLFEKGDLNSLIFYSGLEEKPMLIGFSDEKES